MKTWEPIDFTIYFSFIRWPLLIWLVIEVAFRYWAGSLSQGIFYERPDEVAWVIRLAVFGLLGWLVFRNFGSSKMIAVISGSLIGFAGGLLVALFRFIESIKLWKFFNIITETITVALVAALVAVLVVMVLSFKRLKR